MNRRNLLKTTLASLATAAWPFAPARAYPDRTIRLIVPFSPGGATDVVGRLWAERMKAPIGIVVVENKGGGGGVIGATEVARSQPDGHTFLFGNTSTQVLIPAIASHPAYDPLKDFVSIYILCVSPNSIVVHESVPARTLQELIAYAKANPGKLSYGSAGTGTMTNLAGELFKQLIGAPDIVHVPYKGAAPGVADLASGHIPMMTPNVGGTLLEFHRTGKSPHPRDNFGEAAENRARHPDRDRSGIAGHVGRQLQRTVRPGRNSKAHRRPDRQGHRRGHDG